MNRLYPKGAQRILSGQVNFATDTIKVALVPNTYVFSTAHQYLSEVGAVVGVAQTLTNKTIADGVLDADDLAFGSLAAGSTVKALVMYQDTGSASTSPVLGYYDEVTGFPFPTNGGDVSVPWSDGPYKIISLV